MHIFSLMYKLILVLIGLVNFTSISFGQRVNRDSTSLGRMIRLMENDTSQFAIEVLEFNIRSIINPSVPDNQQIDFINKYLYLVKSPEMKVDLSHRLHLLYYNNDDLIKSQKMLQQAAALILQYPISLKLRYEHEHLEINNLLGKGQYHEVKQRLIKAIRYSWRLKDSSLIPLESMFITFFDSQIEGDTLVQTKTIIPKTFLDSLSARKKFLSKKYGSGFLSNPFVNEKKELYVTPNNSKTIESSIEEKLADSSTWLSNRELGLLKNELATACFYNSPLSDFFFSKIDLGNFKSRFSNLSSSDKNLLHKALIKSHDALVHWVPELKSDNYLDFPSINQMLDKRDAYVPLILKVFTLAFTYISESMESGEGDLKDSPLLKSAIRHSKLAVKLLMLDRESFHERSFINDGQLASHLTDFHLVLVFALNSIVQNNSSLNEFIQASELLKGVLAEKQIHDRHELINITAKEKEEFNSLNRKILDVKMSEELAELEILEESRNKFLNNLRRKNLDFNSVISVDKIQSKLKENQVLLTYHTQKAENGLILCLFISQDTAFITPTSKDVDFPIWKKDILNSINPLNNFNQSSYRMFRNILFNPLVSYLGEINDIDELIIIPSNELSLIPFESLIMNRKNINAGPDEQHYLGNSFSIQYSYSLKSFLKIENGDIKKDIIAFAPRNSGLDLNGAKMELDSISKVVTSNDIAKFRPFRGVNSSKESFKKNVKNYKGIIHLSTHGKIDPVEFENSYLDFLDSSEALHFEEILDLDLDCSLLFLAACNTGSGQLGLGEGVMSFMRAFYIAGAKNQIVSLWKINDDATAQFVTFFYKNLFHNPESYLDLSEALYYTKIDMIESKTYSNPYYWSSFVLYKG